MNRWPRRAFAAKRAGSAWPKSSFALVISVANRCRKWRIVPEDLWQAAHTRMAAKTLKFSASCLGGLNRTERSRSYLFSPARCGMCGSHLVITSGSGNRAYVRYGCPSHRYRGACENGLTIRRDRLEEQLVGAIDERILNSELIDCALQQFQIALQKRLDDLQPETTGLEKLRRERQHLKATADRLADAIAEMGHSPAVLAKLGEVDAQIAGVDRRMDDLKPLDLTATVAELRAFVVRNIMDRRTFLRGRPEQV